MFKNAFAAIITNKKLANKKLANKYLPLHIYQKWRVLFWTALSRSPLDGATVLCSHTKYASCVSLFDLI